MTASNSLERRRSRYVCSAAKPYLQRHPGSYELVRRILGHKKMATTLSFYTGLESKWALRHYDEEVLSRRGKA